MNTRVQQKIILERIGSKSFGHLERKTKSDIVRFQSLTDAATKASNLVAAGHPYSYSCFIFAVETGKQYLENPAH